MKDKKTVIFISTVNLTTNPRVFKEIMLADSMGYEITFLGFYLGNWSDEPDIELQKKMPQVKLTYLQAARNPFMPWLISTFIEKAARVMYKLFPSGLRINAFASSKRSVLLLRHLKEMNKANQKFDMIVAHTSGALYPAYWYAEKTNTKFAFDVEDYHPWESIKGNSSYEVKRREAILKQILPHAHYVTAAAPLIAKEVNRLVPGVKPVTVYNSFPKKEFVEPVEIKSDKIKLVWFSQNINAGRGLEIILEIWEALKHNFELTLIGNLDQQFYEQYLKGLTEINLVPPMVQSELHKHLSQFDIGLAIDVDGEDDNRKLVITNKILAYYQAGLYIVATNTPAQHQFINDNAEHGIIIEQTPEAALKSLTALFETKAEIRKSAIKRFETASAFNWENESGLLAKIWN